MTFLSVALGNKCARDLCESVIVSMSPEDYDRGYALAHEWLNLKEFGPVDKYHGPLRAYYVS